MIDAKLNNKVVMGAALNTLPELDAPSALQKFDDQSAALQRNTVGIVRIVARHAFELTPTRQPLVIANLILALTLQ
jgi:hypothetical protein